MTLQDQFEQAVQGSWVIRQAQADKQFAAGRVDSGTRGSVTGGAHLDALASLVAKIFVDAGCDPSAIRLGSRIEIPGYYRPTKNWDLIVHQNGVLVAAIEFKSQAGSFGNNYNNRTEEALGSAYDVRRAYETGLLGAAPPWLGYLFLLEETVVSTRPVTLASRPIFPVDPMFHGASYAERYEILCQRLLEDGLYDAVCFALTSRDPGMTAWHPSPELSFDAFAAAIAERVKFIERLPAR